LAVVATASASFGRTPAGPGQGSADVEMHAVLDSVDARLSRLERGLGMPSAGATDEAQAFRARYAALRAREQAVARRAEELLRFVPSASPVPGGVITSAFSPGRYHPIKQRVIPHVGLDIAAPQGTAVHAAADGAVLATASHPTYGLTVDLRHGESGFITRYAHLSRIAVRPGQAVRRGDVIGSVGSTGLSTGPHTHYEVFFQGWRRDPIDFLPPGRLAADALLGAD
jgi:murein DD-endopeptidase MepM/ murein hydrolase activator NlpD